MSVDKYLLDEEVSKVRHEYLEGLIYAMAGASTAYNRISLGLKLTLEELYERVTFAESAVA